MSEENVEEPREANGEIAAQADGRHGDDDRLVLPDHWVHSGTAFHLVAQTTASGTVFQAFVRYVEAFGFWAYHVAMNGEVVAMGEQAERTRAMIECEDQAHRAWKLRGPLRTCVVP